MNTVTIPQKEYRMLMQRQEKVERELDLLKKIIRKEMQEEQIRPSILKRWEGISRDLDHGKGHSFSGAKEMRKWLKNL